jgi:hypothetical protein
MCDVLISAAILFALVEWLGDDAIDFTGAAILALVGFVIVLGTTFGLGRQLGGGAFLAGNALAGVVVAAILFLKYGVHVGRAFLIGGLYVVGGLAWKFGLAVLVASVF